MSTRRTTTGSPSRRGSLLFEMVIALGIFAASAITISGVFVRAADTVANDRDRAEADDLARSALTLIEVGVISPEAADRLGEHELRGLVAADVTDVGLETTAEPRFEITVQTEPTSWRTLTRVTVSVGAPDSESVLARAEGLVDLGRIRGGAFRDVGGVEGVSP